MHEELKDLEGILAYTEAKTALESGEDDARPLDRDVREIWEGKVTGDQ